MENDKIRDEIKRLVSEYVNCASGDFIPGETPVLTGQAVYDEKELNAIIETLLDGWFGLGQKGAQFEKQFANYIGTDYGCLVNSGSSANLVALNAVKIRYGLKGGEIITPACAFPTTLNPIIQLGFKPVFVDVDRTLNINPEVVAQAINERTVGMVFAHTLGNPARVAEIKELADQHNLFLIEDCCDAHGSKYNGQVCGTYGDCATFSFYPAHGMTLGEGGILLTSDRELYRIAKSLRDWGRDCYCTTDEKNINGRCGKRFDYDLGGIPYDHKYIYSNIGYNLKPLELQAAMGLEQLKKLDRFNETRKKNYQLYEETLLPYRDFFSLPLINEGADPVFFGLPLVIEEPTLKRIELVKYLNEHKIATRFLFGGNLLKHPAYQRLDYSQYGSLDYTNKLMKDCFWIGLHPGITPSAINYVTDVLKSYLN